MLLCSFPLKRIIRLHKTFPNSYETDCAGQEKCYFWSVSTNNNHQFNHHFLFCWDKSCSPPTCIRDLGFCFQQKPVLDIFLGDLDFFLSTSVILRRQQKERVWYIQFVHWFFWSPWILALAETKKHLFACM